MSRHQVVCRAAIRQGTMPLTTGLRLLRPSSTRLRLGGTLHLPGCCSLGATGGSSMQPQRAAFLRICLRRCSKANVWGNRRKNNLVSPFYIFISLLYPPHLRHMSVACHIYSSVHKSLRAHTAHANTHSLSLTHTPCNIGELHAHTPHCKTQRTCQIINKSSFTSQWNQSCY